MAKAIRLGSLTRIDRDKEVYWVEEPSRNVLHELPPAATLLHKELQLPTDERRLRPN